MAKTPPQRKRKEDKKMKMIKVEPGKAPKIIDIDGELKTLQKQVGGYIELYIPFSDEVAIICNEDGKVLGLPMNRAIYDENTDDMIDIIVGTFLITYAPSTSENFESLPDDLLAIYLEMFSVPEEFVRINGRISALPCGTLN